MSTKSPKYWIMTYHKSPQFWIFMVDSPSYREGGLYTVAHITYPKESKSSLMLIEFQIS